MSLANYDRYEEFVTATGYAYKYAQWLLNHVEEVFALLTAPRRRYGPEIEAVLVLAWKTLNRICAKRLILFLPDMLETLEKEGHVQLSQDHRDLLLLMSAATAGIPLTETGTWKANKLAEKPPAA